MLTPAGVMVVTVAEGTVEHILSGRNLVVTEVEEKDMAVDATVVVTTVVAHIHTEPAIAAAVTAGMMVAAVVAIMAVVPRVAMRGTAAEVLLAILVVGEAARVPVTVVAPMEATQGTTRKRMKTVGPTAAMK